MANYVPPLSPDEFAQRFADLHPAFQPQEAVVEATRCLYCYDAPCAAACPTHIDVPRFIKKIATGICAGRPRLFWMRTFWVELFARMSSRRAVRRRVRDASLQQDAD
jgi:NADPH-dependent glutamate synthase beta subunit-like oxidoreductase